MKLGPPLMRLPTMDNIVINNRTYVPSHYVREFEQYEIFGIDRTKMGLSEKEQKEYIDATKKKMEELYKQLVASAGHFHDDKEEFKRKVLHMEEEIVLEPTLKKLENGNYFLLMPKGPIPHDKGKIELAIRKSIEDCLPPFSKGIIEGIANDVVEKFKLNIGWI